MKNTVQDHSSRVLERGRQILAELGKVICEVNSLRDDCNPSHQLAIGHCKDALECTAIDIASICTDGAEWPAIREMLTAAGIAVDPDVDHDLGSL